MTYWLMKSEPDCFSIDDLKKRPKKTEHWDGVRNYQVRNFMRDRMQVGDEAFFYHSNCAEPGIYGLMEIVSPAYPDHTQFEPDHDHYDPKSDREHPRWLMVDVRYKRHTKRPILLAELRQHEQDLGGFKLIAKGNRLSVIPVSPEHWRYVLSLEG